jgi:hypothetical protein
MSLVHDRVLARRSKMSRGWEDIRDGIVSSLKEAGIYHVVLEGLEAPNAEMAEEEAIDYARYTLGGEIIKRYYPHFNIIKDIDRESFATWIFPCYDRITVDPPGDDEAQFPWGLLAVFGIAAAIPVTWAIFNGLGR